MKTWLALTEGFLIRFDVERMKTDLETVQNSVACLSYYDHALSRGWCAILLKSKNGDVSGPTSQYPSWDFSDNRRTPYVDQLPYFRDLMDELKCSPGRIRIRRLNPGCFPKPMAWQIGLLTTRTTWPTYWKLRQLRVCGSSGSTMRDRGRRFLNAAFVANTGRPRRSAIGDPRRQSASRTTRESR